MGSTEDACSQGCWDYQECASTALAKLPCCKNVGGLFYCECENGFQPRFGENYCISKDRLAEVAATCVTEKEDTSADAVASDETELATELPSDIVTDSSSNRSLSDGKTLAEKCTSWSYFSNGPISINGSGGLYCKTSNAAYKCDSYTGRSIFMISCPANMNIANLIIFWPRLFFFLVYFILTKGIIQKAFGYVLY